MKNMFCLILFPLITAFSSTATVQTTQLPDPPKGFIPMESDAPDKLPPSEHEKERLDAFAKEDITQLQNATVFLGDSITEGLNIHHYFPNELVVNRGISSEGIGGYQSFGTINRLDSTVFNLHPKRIILMVGVNDTPGMSADSTEPKLLQYDYLIWKIRHALPKTELWCISLLPTRGNFSYLNPRIINFNKHIRQTASYYGAQWLNVHSSFLDKKKELKPEYTHDGLHPNTAGYDILAKLYNEHIFKKS